LFFSSLKFGFSSSVTRYGSRIDCCRSRVILADEVRTS
jgi:hypothetical protein